MVDKSCLDSIDCIALDHSFALNVTSCIRADHHSALSRSLTHVGGFLPCASTPLEAR